MHGKCLRPFVFVTGSITAAASAGQLHFTDHTAAAGIRFLHQPALLFELSATIVAYMTAGGAAGDFNRDGFQDLFMVGSGGAADALYINNGDGTFTDRAAEWGVQLHHMGVSASVADYDRDGWLDIYVTSFGPPDAAPKPGRHLLYRNNAGRSFTDVAAQAGVHATSFTKADGLGSTWGDYDVDGDLGLYVAGWLFNSGGNVLFRNNGDGTFTNVTAVAGLSAPFMRGFSPVFADFDQDRYVDLYIAADFKTSRYYINNRDGTFTLATASSGTGKEKNGMGACVGDVNRDGLPDLYVTSIYTPNPKIGVPGTGNTLYLNQGGHSYIEVADAAGVIDGGWGWGALACDLDLSSHVDLLETNGWPFLPEFMNENCKLFLNDSSASFVEIAAECGFINTMQGRGLVNLDLDNDGDQDIVVHSYKDFAMLLRNDVDDPQASLRVFLNTSANPRIAPDGYGARVQINTDAGLQSAWIIGGSRYLSQGELSAHFGLGSATVIHQLRVDWPDGTATDFGSVEPGTRTLVAVDHCDLNHDSRIDGADLGLLLGLWGDLGPTGDLNADGLVAEIDLALLLKHWKP